MSSIRTEWVALDTNEFIYAVRRTPGEEASVELVWERLYDLRVFVPHQVFAELQDNFTTREQAEFQTVLRTAQDWHISYVPAEASLTDLHRRKGAKKGDALIAAELDAAGVRWLISENRHFLSEIGDLPFGVPSAADAIGLITAPSNDD